VNLKHKGLRRTVLLIMIMSAACAVPPLTAQVISAQSRYLDQWPDGVGPMAVGTVVGHHFVASPHQYTESIHYSEVVAWYGALTFADATHDTALRDSLIKRFEPLMAGGSEANRIPVRRHVDDSVFGVVPLEIARQTHDPRFLKAGLAWADRQWEQPRPDGLSGETRFWIDDMYMITLLQVEAYRATHDEKYLDRAALEMSVYLDKLQQPNGLFFHAQDVPIFWGRGNGWVAAGMAEILTELPPSHPQYAHILRSYRLMMSSLLADQGKDGTWRQLLDHDEAWPETSSTGMFTFAMIQGVKHGWLQPEVFGPAAHRAWIALVGYVDQNGDMTNVCEGTDKKNDVAYYLARKRRTGDFHGQAPLLWAATALLR
jgi:unsaturated rhamnogalacturonyl hydrolase